MANLQSNMLNETRKLLAERPRTLTLPTISEATGLTVPWLVHLAGKPDADFGVRKVETLKVYLESLK